MMTARHLPLPATMEARNRGCTCPQPRLAQLAGDEPRTIDRNCPVHGIVAMARVRAAERAPTDTEGDIVDAASEPSLRRS